jgi:hypothetical protein
MAGWRNASLLAELKAIGLNLTWTDVWILKIED